MPPQPVPFRPIDAYKQIIDGLVEDSRSIHGRLVVEEGIYSRAEGSEHLNAFVRSLTPDQRALLREMFDAERQSGIGSTLSLLTWWKVCRELAFTYRGEIMPVELSGMGLEGDYVGRLQGWQWPPDPAEA